MLGKSGEVIEPINGEGRVFVHGESWQACADQPIAVGTKIEIIQVMDGLNLKVKAIETMGQIKAIESEED
jgi:membrane-bound serine protease (ClpP class)